MSQTFDAIYEHGILRPLSPIVLNEHDVVSVTILGPQRDQAADAESEQLARRQREAILRFVEEMKSMPDNSPKDGLTNRDHDQILYGPQS
jgi:predicted DNA-binding antitoxin AbrB/MazE fold protein